MSAQIGVLRRARNKLVRVLRSPRKIDPNDTSIVKELKHTFGHGPREFQDGLRRYSVDCLYCHAVPGTFETSLTLLCELKERGPGNSLLNVGGGTGQVAPILLSLGFTVVNLDMEVEAPDELNLKVDLNVPGPLPIDAERFDFVLCQEVIEHVENPWDLFRKVRTALKVGGYLVLTTPNVQSLHSKKRFIETGYFDWFTPDCFAYHINALPLWEIDLIRSRIGFRQVGLFGNGDYYFRRGVAQLTPTMLSNNEALVFLLEAT